MTRLIVPLLALGVITVAASGENEVPWANKFFMAKGKDTPPVIVQDFGKLKKGTVQTYRFQLTNHYRIAFEVREPRASNGCVTVLKYSANLSPGDAGYIDIQIDTKRVDGKKEIMLPVFFFAKDQKSGEPYFSEAQVEIRVVSQ